MTEQEQKAFDQMREALGQMIACHDEPTCPAISTATEALAAANVAVANQQEIDKNSTETRANAGFDGGGELSQPLSESAANVVINRGICGEIRGACGLPCEPCESKPDPEWVTRQLKAQKDTQEFQNGYDTGYEAGVLHASMGITQSVQKHPILQLWEDESQAIIDAGWTERTKTFAPQEKNDSQT